MAKDIPYFKFFPGEWLKGDITLCSYEVQGVFINICAYYWAKEGDLNLTGVQQRFDNDIIDTLLLEKIIVSVEENKIEKIKINFLDEQLFEFRKINRLKSKAGKRSAEVRKSRVTPVQHVLNSVPTEPQQNVDSVPTKINKEEKRIEDNRREDNIGDKPSKILVDRDREFRQSVLAHTDRFGKAMVVDFYNYWSEPNKSKTKMRFELEKTWDLERRLNTWEKRSKQFKPNNTPKNDSDFEIN